MRGGVPVLLLVALAGFESVLSASLEAAGSQDLLYETADEISDLQKRDEITLEKAEVEEGDLEDGTFMEATRDEIEEITQEEEDEVVEMTQEDEDEAEAAGIIREEDTDDLTDEEAVVKEEAAAETLEAMEEESQEAEEEESMEDTDRLIKAKEMNNLDQEYEDTSQEEGALEE